MEVTSCRLKIIEMKKYGAEDFRFNVERMLKSISYTINDSKHETAKIKIHFHNDQSYKNIFNS